MAIIRSLLVKVGADISDLQKGLTSAQKKLEKSSRELAQLGGNLTRNLTLPLLAVGGAATKMAMDAVESENLFKESMGAMADDARAWSEQLRDQLGLNAYEVRKNVATFNVMFDSMGIGEQAAYDMAKSLTQLSYDMASFYNLKPEEAFQKLQAGISGEIEPLKRLGILINDTTIKTYAYTHGIAEQGAQLTEQQKVQARYRLILEQTAKAQGDLARTMESPTNRLRMMGEEVKNLAVDLGVQLLPVFNGLLKVGKTVLGWVSSLVNWFKNLDDVTKTVILSVLAFAAAVGPVILVISKLIGLKASIIGLFATITTKANLVGLALTALVIVGVAVYKNWDKIVRFGQDVWYKIKMTVLESVKSMIDGLAKFAKYIPGLGDKVKDLGVSLGNMIEEAKENRKWQLYARSLENVQNATSKLNDSSKNLAEQIKITNSVVAETGKSVQTTSKYYEMAKNELKAMEQQVDFLSRRIKQQEEVVKGLETQLNIAKEAYKKTTDAIKEIEQAISDTQNTIRNFGSAPLKEAKVLEDQMWAIEQQSAALELQLLKIKMGQGPAEDAEKVQAELDNLKLQAEELRLRERLEIEPLRRELQQLTDDTKYLTFEEARNGALDAKNKLVNLQQQMMSLQQTEAQQLQTLTDLQSKYDAQVQVLDNLKEAHDIAKDAVKELKDAIKDMVDMSKQQYDELIAKVREAQQAMQQKIQQTTVTAGSVSSGANSAISQAQRDAQIAYDAGVISRDVYDRVMNSVPSYATGTDRVPYTGLFKLHEGEAVIPKNRNTGGGDIVFTGDVHFHGVQNMEQMKKEIQRRTGRAV